MSEASEKSPPSELSRWQIPGVLFVLTFTSMMYVGQDPKEGASDIANALSGWPFAVPLMAILLAHEMGHYIAGRLHKVEISPPYFIPMPIFLLGTMGAVIRMNAIERRNALLDIGAAGPIAGMVVAIPVLIWGIHTSDVIAISPDMPGVFVEGRSFLYFGLLYAIKGPIPAGHDIWLNGPALAGWAGLLVTQINLIPVAQLDGGHVAYALFGKKQDRYAMFVYRTLPVLAVVVGAAYTAAGYARGERGAELSGEMLAGMHWLVWFGMLALMMRLAGKEHPPTVDEPLTPARKIVAIATLVLFALLFMPSWMYVPNGSPF
jgi:membrane-associated protease RseP (regulator of RpoE activity)